MNTDSIDIITLFIFILTEKTLLSEQGQSSLAMPGNKTREHWSIGELEYWNKNRRL
jgi:hypothetical protein